MTTRFSHAAAKRLQRLDRFGGGRRVEDHAPRFAAVDAAEVLVDDSPSAFVRW
jgi:hypothetical protein